jgi:hypothetical protein
MSMLSMDQFQRFLMTKDASKNLSEAFYYYLMAKYPNGMPSDLNLEQEWKEFLSEATSHL